MSENPLFDGTLAVTIGGHDVTAALLPGLSYSSSNPGGFGEATFSLPATDPWAAYTVSGHTVAKGDAVAIAHGAVTLFEGEITSDVSHAVVGGGQAWYEVTCAGLWWKAAQRRDFCIAICDNEPEAWFTVELDGRYETTNSDGILQIVLNEGDQVATWGGCLAYWINSGMCGETQWQVHAFAGTIEGGFSEFDDVHAEIQYALHPWAVAGDWTTAWTSSVLGSPEKFCAALPVGDYFALRLVLHSPTPPSPTALGMNWVRVTDFAVIGEREAFGNAGRTLTISAITASSPVLVTTTAAHGLKTGDTVLMEATNSTTHVDGIHEVTYVDADTFSVVGTASSTGDSGMVHTLPRLDEAMAGVATATGLATSADLDAVNIGVSQMGLVARPFGSRAAAIETFAALSADPIDYGFWDGAVFSCHARVAPTSGSNDYLIDSSAPGIDFDVFKDTEDSPTHVSVLYSERASAWYPVGTRCHVVRPSTPTWDDATARLDVWDQWSDMSLTQTQANCIADQILAWIGENAYEGSISIATPTVPLRGGGTKTAAYIRAGEYIECSQLSTGPLMITSVSVDVDSGVVNLGIGQSRAEFVTRIKALKGVPPRPGEATGTVERDPRINADADLAARTQAYLAAHERNADLYARTDAYWQAHYRYIKTRPR